MANVVKQFRNMSLDLDNQPMAGTVEEFHLQLVSRHGHLTRRVGMDVPVLLDMGMNVLMARAYGQRVSAKSIFSIWSCR